MFILNIGALYKIYNRSTIKTDISIVDGNIDVNGKKYC